jgi:predicted nucleic acid-binding protein
MYWTEDILEEVRRNLINRRGLSTEQAEYLIGEMKRYFPEALVIRHKPLIPSMTNDPKDRHVLAAAVASGAQVIVTNNLRDFPKEALESFGVEAQPPDDFLTHLYHLDSDGLRKLLERQAQDLLSPPKTTAELLSTLEQHAPTLIKLMRNELCYLPQPTLKLANRIVRPIKPVGSA